MSGKRNRVVYEKPEEPAFLKKIKAKIGYQKGPDIDTKKEELPAADDQDYQDREDEKPSLVLLQDSKVTETEAKEYLNCLIFDENKNKNKSKRIMFNKPEKKQNQESEEKIKRKKLLHDSYLRGKSNKLSSNLLSFGNYDEQEDDNDET